MKRRRQRTWISVGFGGRKKMGMCERGAVDGKELFVSLHGLWMKARGALQVPVLDHRVIDTPE